MCSLSVIFKDFARISVWMSRVYSCGQSKVSSERRLSCKHHTAPRALHTRKHFFRVWLKKLEGLSTLCFFLCLPQIKLFVTPVCRVSCAVIAVRLPAFFHIHSTFPLCHVPRTVFNPAIHGQPGFSAEQGPLTNHEPNVTVEVSSAEVTPRLLPSTRASFCSAYNSAEDVTTTHVSSEVDKKHSM